MVSISEFTKNLNMMCPICGNVGSRVQSAPFLWSDCLKYKIRCGKCGSSYILEFDPRKYDIVGAFVR
jgi:transcription elongation factor Elf1